MPQEGLVYPIYDLGERRAGLYDTKLSIFIFDRHPAAFGT